MDRIGADILRWVEEQAPEREEIARWMNRLPENLSLIDDDQHPWERAQLRDADAFLALLRERLGLGKGAGG